MNDATERSERWLPVVGYEGEYEVSDLGRVRSFSRMVYAGRGWERLQAGRLLKARTDHRGRPTVGLCRNGKQHRRPLHHLVLEAFVGLRPPGMECCHYDDDPLNNKLENLRWDTKSANMRDQVRNGRHHGARKTHCKYGHELTPDNVCPSRARRGHRQCLECRRDRWRRDGDRINRQRREKRAARVA
jgi:hypothetical protein